MSENPISKESILAAMRDPRNRGRKLWTASVVLDRMGIYRRTEDQGNYSKVNRRRVRALLHDLQLEGIVEVVKERHTLHSSTWTAEVAYGLVES